jgi:hypothetical protein
MTCDYINFICYLVALIEIHSTCAKKARDFNYVKENFSLTFYVQVSNQVNQVSLCFAGCDNACRRAFGVKGER